MLRALMPTFGMKDAKDILSQYARTKDVQDNLLLAIYFFLR
jgi:hypothetical protein